MVVPCKADETYYISLHILITFPVSQRDFYIIVLEYAAGKTKRLQSSITAKRHFSSTNVVHVKMVYCMLTPILCIGEYNNVNPKSTTILA